MLCVIAKLSEEAAETLAGIRCAALPEDEGAKRLYGHVTIASYTGADEAGFLRACKALLEGTPRFAVEYERIEVLEETSILAAIPGKSGPLETLHRRIAERYEGDLDQWTRADRWYPHTTLLYGPALDLQELCRRMRAAFHPFSAVVCRIEFSRVLDTGYEVLDQICLLSEGELPG